MPCVHTVTLPWVQLGYCNWDNSCSSNFVRQKTETNCWSHRTAMTTVKWLHSPPYIPWDGFVLTDEHTECCNSLISTDNPPFDPVWQTVASATPWRHSLLTLRTVNLKRSVHTVSQKNAMILPAEKFTLSSVELQYRLKRRSSSLFYVTDWNWLRGMLHNTWKYPAPFFSVSWAYCGRFMTASGPL